MIIHYIIRKQIIENGVWLISDLRLYNILMDVDAFKYEAPSLKFVLRQTITNYGGKILSAYRCGQPATLTIDQYVKDSTTRFGFVENQARYAMESLAFGLGWIRSIEIDASKLSNSEGKSFELKLEVTAFVYHLMGMNITQIQGSAAKNIEHRRNDYYARGIISDYDSYKDSANENWRDFIDSPQGWEMVNSLRWAHKTGIGIICGFNNVRAIDIDDLGCFNDCSRDFYDNPRAKQDIPFDKFIDKCLSLLNLPKDYEWVVRTGSGRGLHIIFKCEDVEDLNMDVAAFPPGNIEEDLDLSDEFVYGIIQFEHTGKLKQDFSRLELFWKGHIASPPSKGDGYDHREEVSGGWGPNPFEYDFINTSGFLPSYEPMEIYTVSVCLDSNVSDLM